MASAKISCLSMFVLFVFHIGTKCSGAKTIRSRRMHLQTTSFNTTSRLSSTAEYDDDYKSSIFDVISFGAKGNGVTDDTNAFQAAWQAACKTAAGSSVLHVPSKFSFLVGPISFIGPCQSSIVFKVDGTIVASVKPWAWCFSNFLQWLLFSNLRDITVTGNGVIDGQGAIWWKLSEYHENNKGWFRLPSFQRPTAIRFYGSYNVNVQNIKIKDSPQCHLKFDSCTSVKVDRIKISSPANSPNTDGVHLQNSRDVEISNSSMGCGDDCISIQTGCSDVRIHNIDCGPGHGISIGGLGKDNTRACVSNVTVEDSTIQDALNGVRIKTWQGGLGSVRGVSFANIKVSNVRFPIIIDQFYCDQRACRNLSSAVAISEVTYANIKGTYLDTALHLACSDHVPCTYISLTNIDLRPVHVCGKPFCWNTYGQVETPTVPQVDCLQALDSRQNFSRIQSNADGC